MKCACGKTATIFYIAYDGEEGEWLCKECLRELKELMEEFENVLGYAAHSSKSKVDKDLGCE